LFVFLSLDSAVDLLDLHSFPTRRSSDLPGGDAHAALGSLHGDAISDGRCARAAARAAVVRARPRRTPGRGAPGAPRAAVAGAITDRKSTRLNSSHLGISYAVFCLKKKKI